MCKSIELRITNQELRFMREDKINKIEAHVAGICFDGDNVLCLKRSPERKIYPNLWECGGGAVWPGENFEEAVLRELRDESGIIAECLGVSGVYEILTPDLEQKKIPGLKMTCRFLGYEGGTNEPKLSSEHVEWKWVSVDKLDGIDFIPGVADDIRAAYEIYRKM
ncbi:hypothetical protein A2Y83_01100 [Candidatus Falkowbacteria bacterium RBG_13_39_14]|uniref:Nudix hydrolase domain-containing protein n=1 Tax=Candidatus Falkowbacteria bacterium RBG_13_39_14 TaxID=1797985 RepID=A0A1F5S7T2_9BACT|nr:MAG: hypothetical protein A2Y83_01100 [Candidatus Falkowbacteria bacterium RBG_13_39_14]